MYRCLKGCKLCLCLLKVLSLNRDRQVSPLLNPLSALNNLLLNDVIVDSSVIIESFILRILLIANLYHRLIYLLIQFSHISYQLCLIFLGIQPGIIVKYYLVDIYSNSVDFINEFLQNLPYFRMIE